MVPGAAALRAGRGTPLGPVWVEVSDGVVVAAGWGNAPAGREVAALDLLDGYFLGEVTDFTGAVDLGGTGFCAEVRRAMAAIPYGETRTYGEIARDLGAPAQAVGQACGGNPIPIFVPCHRVVGAGSLGGYSGGRGVETKAWLLRHEGAMLI